MSNINSGTGRLCCANNLNVKSVPVYEMSIRNPDFYFSNGGKHKNMSAEHQATNINKLIISDL